METVRMQYVACGKLETVRILDMRVRPVCEAGKFTGRVTGKVYGEGCRERVQGRVVGKGYGKGYGEECRERVQGRVTK